MTTVETVRFFVLDAINTAEEDNAAAPRPCPDFGAHLNESRLAVIACDTVEQIAAVEYVAARAELARYP
jgi:hypothetical protein